MSKIGDILSKLENLHGNAVDTLASAIDLKMQPVLLYALKGAPGVGKTTMLRNIKNLIVDRNEEKVNDGKIIFYSNKLSLGDAMEDFLKNHEITDKQIGNAEKVIFLIDDLDRYFNKNHELFFRYLIACEYNFDVVVIVTTKITQPSIPLTYNNVSTEDATWLVEASEAMKLYEYITIAPIWDEYIDVIEEIIGDIFSNDLPNENEERFDIRNLATLILKFCGPFPPALKHVLFHLALGLWEKKKIENLSASEENDVVALEILDSGLQYIYFAALEWMYQNFQNFQETVDQGFNFSELDNKNLSDACLMWGRKSKVARRINDFPFEKSPQLLQVAFNNWVIVKKRQHFTQSEALVGRLPSGPTGRRTIVATGNGADVGGGKLMIKVGEQDVDEIELSRLEWMVFSKLVADRAVEVKALLEQLANEVDFQGLNNAEAKIRSALSRIIEKAEEKNCDWILQNLPRRGYLLRLTQPEPNHA